jgi:1-deoxy-D-xylulose 5-phosphate reductoisomerase
MSTGVVILGSTGSIGRQALDVLRDHRDDYHVVALAAGRNAEALAAQAAELGLGPDEARLCGDDAAPLEELAAHPDADVVLNASSASPACRPR